MTLNDNSSSNSTASESPTQTKEEQIEQLKKYLHEVDGMHSNAIVSMQCAYLESQYGRGVHAAMNWIENFLDGPGLIPSENEPYITRPDLYHHHNAKNIFAAKDVQRPTCFCGVPAMIMGHYEGKGFTGYCSFEHERQGKLGIENLPKPQQIIIPMSRIRALMQFTDKNSDSYRKYIIVQFDKDLNVMATATDSNIIGQYRPNGFDANNILENILLAPAALELISGYGDFENLVLTRTPDNQWLCHHAEFEIIFKSEDKERVPQGVSTLIHAVQNHDNAVVATSFQAKYMDVMAKVGNILGALPSIQIKNYNQSAVKSDQPDPALALVRFFKVSDFTAAVMSLRNEKVDGHA